MLFSFLCTFFLNLGHFVYLYVHAMCMRLWTHTKSGVQKQPANTLWVAVFLVFENLTGYNFLLQLKERKKNQTR